MTQACISLGMKLSTFKRRAQKLGVYKPNPSGKGLKRPRSEGSGKYSLNDILTGKYPQYPSHKLRIRLIEANIKEDVCECCGQINIWNERPLSMHLDHIDGNHANHLIENLRILCPNCHTQTDTYGSKVRK